LTCPDRRRANGSYVTTPPAQTASQKGYQHDL
jgi:hypothetical protein